jgi:hypothetical protein
MSNAPGANNPVVLRHNPVALWKQSRKQARTAAGPYGPSSESRFLDGRLIAGIAGRPRSNGRLVIRLVYRIEPRAAQTERKL